MSVQPGRLTKRPGIATAVLFVSGCLLFGAQAVFAADRLTSLCPFALHERQVQLDDLELSADLARIRLETSEKTYEILENLWKGDGVEHLVYLAGKHHLAVDRIAARRARQMVERQRAIVEQYRLVCSAPPGDDPSSETRRAIEQAQRRYRLVDCEIRALEIESAAVDLEHTRKTLESMLRLREELVVSEEKVILATRDVAMLESQLDQARRRASRCRQEIDRRSRAESQGASHGDSSRQ